VQQGTHAELVLDGTGLYASLWASQSDFSATVIGDGYALHAEVAPDRLR
jgi:hypothetical protein